MRHPVHRPWGVAVALVILTLATAGYAQDRARQRQPARPHPAPGPAPRSARAHVPAPAHRHLVFVGGYFYDPFFGPYPWWMRDRYPYPYFPIFYNQRADVRLAVTPDTAAVYVDGFYAGVVDDFDGVFQSLPLTPGGHTIELYEEGYRTVRRALYLSPASTFKLREVMERLPAGVASEPPKLAPPVPTPPEGSFIPPVTAQRAPLRSAAPVVAESGARGTLRLHVQPADATVTIDGEPWFSSDGGRFEIELPEGQHRIEVAQTGRTSFIQDFEIRNGETRTINVSLVKTT